MTDDPKIADFTTFSLYLAYADPNDGTAGTWHTAPGVDLVDEDGKSIADVVRVLWADLPGLIGALQLAQRQRDAAMADAPGDFG